MAKRGTSDTSSEFVCFRERVRLFTNASPGRAGLDDDNNPDTSLFKSALELSLLQIVPVRDVNWRHGPKSCGAPSQLRAAYVQRIGHELPARDCCKKCVNQDGPFGSCVVAVVNKRPVFDGACANCAYGAGQSRCSFRAEADGFPRFLIDVLREENPGHPAVKAFAAERAISAAYNASLAEAAPLAPAAPVASASPSTPGYGFARTPVVSPARAQAPTVFSRPSASGSALVESFYSSALTDPCFSVSLDQADWPRFRAIHERLDQDLERLVHDRGRLRALLVEHGQLQPTEVAKPGNIFGL